MRLSFQFYWLRCRGTLRTQSYQSRPRPPFRPTSPPLHMSLRGQGLWEDHWFLPFRSIRIHHRPSYWSIPSGGEFIYQYIVDQYHACADKNEAQLTCRQSLACALCLSGRATYAGYVRSFRGSWLWILAFCRNAALGMFPHAQALALKNYHNRH